jgi:hypothetical protein
LETTPIIPLGRISSVITGRDILFAPINLSGIIKRKTIYAVIEMIHT